MTLLIELAIALLGVVSSFLAQRDHVAFRRTCRASHNATGQVNAGPFEIAIDSRTNVRMTTRTYMRPESARCSFPSRGDTFAALPFVATLHKTLRRLFLVIDRAADLSSLSALVGLRELSLTETHNTRVHQMLCSIRFPQLRTLRFHQHGSAPSPVVLDAAMASGMPVLRTLDVWTRGNFAFSGAWPYLETLVWEGTSGTINTVDISGCLRLATIDQHLNLHVDLRVYGPTFIQPYVGCQTKIQLLPATKTLILYRDARSVKTQTTCEGVTAETQWSIDAFSEMRAGADYTWAVVLV
jgi:hypothetical protein